MEFTQRDLLLLKYTPDLGPSRIRQLVTEFKRPETLHKAVPKHFVKLDGFDATLASKVVTNIKKTINDSGIQREIDNQINLVDKYNAKIITVFDESYPANLKNIYDPPLLLFVRGEIIPDDSYSLAVVGSRNVSEYGVLTAEKLSGELAVKGITIVSGMAAGIDSHAHWGCLKTGGRTIAVLGCGLDYIYPASNKKLYEEIIDNGAVISEYPFKTKPLKDNFPARNRIISGLSLGTIIIEASKKSGSLITAKYALEQNREVFAVPGNVSSSRSEGTNALIRDSAAKLVLNADDILTEIGPQVSFGENDSDQKTELKIKLSESEKEVYDLLDEEPVHVDQMVQKSRLTSPIILTQLLTLELKGIIRKLPGGRYVKT